MDGVATVRALRQINPAVRIVCTTGSDGLAKFAELKEQGTLQFVQKPFTVATLLNTVRLALDTPVHRDS